MNFLLKLVSAIFYQIFICAPNDSPSKTMKNAKMFISSKKLFSFSRYLNFCISFLPSFSLWRPLLRGWSKINLKAYDDVNCPGTWSEILLDIMRRKKGMTLKLYLLIEHWTRNIFLQKPIVWRAVNPPPFISNPPIIGVTNPFLEF